MMKLQSPSPNQFNHDSEKELGFSSPVGISEIVQEDEFTIYTDSTYGPIPTHNRAFECAIDIGLKGTQEDRVVMAPQFYSPDIALCSVFDGTSGDFAAHFAANYLPQFLYNTQEMNALYTFTNNKAFLNMPTMKVYETVAKLSEIALRKSFLHLDAVLLQQLQDAELSYTASTNVTLLLWKNLLTVAHLGDSRACIFRETSDGFFSPQWLTVDHKPNHAPEHQRIAQSGGVLSWNSKKPYLRAPDFNEKHMAGKHPKKLNYSRGFGGVELKKYGFIADPEVHHFEICPSDKFLVLATDGLWDVLTPGHVANIIMTSKAKGLCVTSEIIKTAIEEMPDQLINDNISVVVIYL